MLRYALLFVTFVLLSPLSHAYASEFEMWQAKNLVARVFHRISEIIGPPKDGSRDAMVEYSDRLKIATDNDVLCRGGRELLVLEGKSMYPGPVIYRKVLETPDALSWGILMAWGDGHGKGEAAVRFTYIQKYTDGMPVGEPYFEADLRSYKQTNEDPKRSKRLSYPDGRWSIDGTEFFETLDGGDALWLVALKTLLELKPEDIVRECEFHEKRKRT